MIIIQMKNRRSKKIQNFSTTQKDFLNLYINTIQHYNKWRKNENRTRKNNTQFAKKRI